MIRSNIDEMARVRARSDAKYLALQTRIQVLYDRNEKIQNRLKLLIQYNQEIINKTVLLSLRTQSKILAETKVGTAEKQLADYR